MGCGLLLGTALALAEPPSDSFPEFSWERVPQFAFLSLTRKESLSAQQAQVLAERFPLVVLNKHAPADPGRSIEEETFAAAEKIKAINPHVKVLAYWNSTLAIPGSEANEEFASHETWALRDRQGALVQTRQLRLHDFSQAEVRSWWSDACGTLVKHPAIDGVFADAVGKYGIGSPSIRHAVTEDKLSQLREGLADALQQAQRKMGDDPLLIFNGLRGQPTLWPDGGARYLEGSAGAMVEHFAGFSARDKKGRLIPERMVEDFRLIRQASAEGKIVLVRGWPGKLNWLSEEFKTMSAKQKREALEEQIHFPLASFLLVAEPYCYFSYSFGYLSDQGIFEPPPELKRPLGAPLGKATREGLRYTRSFEHAEIRVDLLQETARILWK